MRYAEVTASRYVLLAETTFYLARGGRTFQMQALTIRAASPGSARAMLEALSEFRAELVEAADGEHEVAVTLGASDREIIAVLNALEKYVNDRAIGPARISLAGRTYMLHPDLEAD